jgi:hypothetical protein
MELSNKQLDILKETLGLKETFLLKQELLALLIHGTEEEKLHQVDIRCNKIYHFD